THVTEAPANLGARSHHCAGGPSDEDGGPLDAVLLQQLLPVLPCPHRHHPARRLVPDHQCRGTADSTERPPWLIQISIAFQVLNSELMDDANMCIAIAISLLMILICAMATYGAYKQHAAWIIPFFCYQIFDFALNTLVAVTVLVYPNSIQEYIRQLPPDFPYKDDIMSVNPTCLVHIILLFISIILTFKGYLISCVWNCYQYINGRNSSAVLVYVTSNDTMVLLPPYNDATVNGAAKEPPPPYVSA
ncbi:hypothetical protein EI555_012192, partial [Monodon monoceros]